MVFCRVKLRAQLKWARNGFFVIKSFVYCLSLQIVVCIKLAGLAHPVERHLAKVEVASSSLVTRSNLKSLTAIRFVGLFSLANWHLYYA